MTPLVQVIPAPPFQQTRSLTYLQKQRLRGEKENRMEVENTLTSLWGISVYIRAFARTANLQSSCAIVRPGCGKCVALN